MTRYKSEADSKIIEGTYSEASKIDQESLERAEITNGDGTLKLRSGETVFLEILREKLKNKKSVGRVVTDAVIETYNDRQEEGEAVLKVALEKFEEYYFNNLAGDGVCRDKNKSLKAGDLKPKIVDSFDLPMEFDGSNSSQTEISVPWIESLVTVPARPFMVFSERGRDAMRRVSDENLERLVLDAMRKNDTARARYLIGQATEALSSMENFGVKDKWVKFYENSMTIEYGEGKFPAFASVQGMLKFFKEVYEPLVMQILSQAEIVSVMGDHAATEVVADLEAKMEIILAEKRAEVAEKVQPAQRRVDAETMKTKANEADLYEKHQDVLKRSKKIKSELAMRTVVAPFSAGATEVTEAVFEVAPSGLKAFAEFFRRWYNQEGGDPKLMAVTAGGLAFGLVGGVIGAFTVSWLALPAGIIVLPMASAAGYMAVRGFMKK
jgi:hypothetical protein